MRSTTIEFPWIEEPSIEVGDDVGVAREAWGLAMEEVDDELFISGEEPETGREITHLSL